MFQKISTRTIGVLTKLDIMDECTNAKKILLNEVIPLKLGYVGVKNRSKEDRINELSKAETIRKEKEFFKSHPVYNNLPSGPLGTDALIDKLTEIYFRMIRENSPKIVKTINERMKTDEKELAHFSDLMTLMQNNISNEDEAKESIEKKDIKLANQEMKKAPPSKSGDNMKKKYGNLFG